MSSKHHRSKQGRSHGGYARRLAARGLSAAPTMPTLESLRRRQGARALLDAEFEADRDS